MILLTPGPCLTSEAVRQAAALPDLNHREPLYAEVFHRARYGLLDIYPNLDRSDWVPYLIGGSGTAAVEAMVTSAVETGPVLVLENGYYSGRIREILDAHGIPTYSLSAPWTTEVQPEEVDRFLQTTPVEAVLMTHHETTLGRLNRISEVAAIARRHGARCFVDAMSSFGADPIDFTHLDGVATSYNKCLHGLPGVGIVLLRTELANTIRSWPRRTYYLHLPMYEGDNPPLTPPVAMLRSAAQAIQENGGGQPARHTDYTEKTRRLREGMRARGLKLAIPDEESSITLVTPQLPDGWTYDAWFEANYAAGFVIYGCKGDYRSRYFQVSAMGETTVDHIEQWLDVVDRILTTTG